MEDKTKNYVSSLNNLIETCKDSQQGFRDAAGGVQSTNLSSLLGEYARQREQFATELQTHVQRLGGEAETSGSATGSLHRGWINLKSALTGKDDHAILAECERGEDSAIKNYQQELSGDLPHDLRRVVQDQYEQIQQSHIRIRALRDQSEVKDAAGTPVGARVI